ncbi:MAG: hypothetical protein ABR977_05595 [Candidatus Dormibacteria bacterium]|jgi:hypothetical protein
MSGDEGVGEIPGPPELPGDPSSVHGARVEAAFLGALAGEGAAQAPAAAGDLLEVADSIATVGGFDADDLRRRGLAGSSQAGPAGLLLRAIPFALLAPLDRPRIRRDAYRVAALAGADEGTAVAAIAAALLIADLTRFDLATATVRVYQSLLEDAPFALLERFRPGQAATPAEADDDPGAALQIAMAAVLDAEGIAAAIDAAVAPGRRAAVSLAGALAGAHLGGASLDPGWRAAVPHAHRAVTLAAAVAARAVDLAAASPAPG